MNAHSSILSHCIINIESTFIERLLLKYMLKPTEFERNSLFGQIIAIVK